MDPEGLVGTRVRCGEAHPFPLGRGGVWGEGHATPIINRIFQLKWRVLVHCERYICLYACQKSVEFST